MFRMGYWSAIAICDLTVMHLPPHMVSEWIPRVTVLILNPGRILDDSITSVRQRRMHRRPGGAEAYGYFGSVARNCSTAQTAKFLINRSIRTDMS
jgi:hypothetical protein